MNEHSGHQPEQPLWHLVQVSDVLDLELASALAELVPVLAWEPQRSWLPQLTRPGAEAERLASSSPGEDLPLPTSGPTTGPTTKPSALRIRKLPLLRGFARPPFSWIARTGPSLLQRLLRQNPEPALSPLLCSTPYFAPLAELWPGPVVYWLTDLIAEYSSARRKQVIELDWRMCRAAALVCPNSVRLRQYLIDSAACDPAKIVIIPNATRTANLLPAAPDEPTPLPVAEASRPIAGVIGNLAGNMDWLLLRRLVESTPWLSWVFVGPTSMHIVEPAARKARSEVMRLPNTHFTGRQAYGALAGYARSFDVAVLPYRRCEPTYSGSSTRFYEHLAACRPILATRGLEELTHKTPLLTLFDTAEQGLEALNILRGQHFNDGLQMLRWQSSRQGTWQTRAKTIQSALAERVLLQQGKRPTDGVAESTLFHAASS